MADKPFVETPGPDSTEDTTAPEVKEHAPQIDALDAAQAAKKPSLLMRAWKMTGLDPLTITLMLKGAMAPIICLAAYQSDAWAKKYTTLGYLAAIISFISLAIQPRAKFIQTLTISIFFICIGSAVTLLQIRCVTSAREHTTPAAASHATVTGSSGSKASVAYNASASVVAGCFLFAQVYVANVIRAKRPQLMLPTIQFSIFAVVGSSYSATFPNMAAGESFVQRLLETFLTGMGIAAGVSLFIVPMTSRTIASKQMAGMLGLMKASISGRGQYLMSLSKDSNRSQNGHIASETTSVKVDKHIPGPAALSPEVQAMRGLRDAIAGLFGKLNLEVTFAKKEIAFGHLHPHHFSELIILLRDVLLPVVGMTTFIDIMQSVKDNKYRAAKSMDTEEGNEAVAAIQSLEIHEWEEAMSMSHEQAMKLNGVLCQGLTHVAYQLKLEKKPKATKGDVEKIAGGTPAPGDPGFISVLHDEIQGYARHRENALQRLYDHKGIELPTRFWDDPSQHYTTKELQNMSETAAQKHNQQQLYLILYIEYLNFSLGNAILKLVQYADGKVEDGTMTKKRLIVPALRKIAKLIRSAWSEEDSDGGEHLDQGPAANVYVGDSFKAKKNPEHLPPANWFQKSTDYIRLIPAHFRSDEAAFGFRAAVAVMSIAILNYIHQTQHFFQEQRVMWALIMVAISMSPQTGQGVFGFLARIFGTVVSMVVSITIWYMADQKTAAILPLLYLYAALGIMFIIKKPQLAIVGILSVVTSFLIIGYELQERKIGIKLAVSNGQPFYKVYILAPYRLAAVITGIAVCFIWTYFPYPITTHATLRKDLGATLYLLANFYSTVHSTIDMRLRAGIKAEPGDKKSPIYSLDKARSETFKKSLIMLNRLREHLNFLKFDPNFGGSFPKEEYERLIASMQHMFNYMALMAYSSDTFVTAADEDETQWMAGFRRFAADVDITSHDLTSTLCLTSFSITNAQPLPPYLKLPRPFSVADRMESVDPEILSVKHVSEPCYAAFAVLQVASSLITEEMGNIVRGVADLVGEVDFSLNMMGSESSLATEDRTDKGKLA